VQIGTPCDWLLLPRLCPHDQQRPLLDGGRVHLPRPQALPPLLTPTCHLCAEPFETVFDLCLSRCRSNSQSVVRLCHPLFPRPFSQAYPIHPLCMVGSFNSHLARFRTCHYPRPASRRGHHLPEPTVEESAWSGCVAESLFRGAPEQVHENAYKSELHHCYSLPAADVNGSSGDAEQFKAEVSK
jgi:hypothetical protein